MIPREGDGAKRSAISLRRTLEIRFGLATGPEARTSARRILKPRNKMITNSFL